MKKILDVALSPIVLLMFWFDTILQRSHGWLLAVLCAVGFAVVLVLLLIAAEQAVYMVQMYILSQLSFSI